MYKQGKGVPQDYAKYIEWYTKSNKKLGTSINIGLIKIYFKGKNLSQDYIDAAEKGDIKVQMLLGMLYSKDEDVPKDYTQAVKWYTKAADQGYKEIQHMITVMPQE